MKENLLNLNKQKEKEMSSKKYQVIRPGGNDTALVSGLEEDQDRREIINNQIMAQNPNVEQVGFVELDPQRTKLTMAGGEFCGNATRSAAYLALNGQEGKLKIKVYGVEKELSAGVKNNGEAWAEMPVYADPQKISFQDNLAIVEMDGITQVVMPDQLDPNLDAQALKDFAKNKLAELNLIENIPASGIILLSETENGLSIRPIVWVPSVNTLFYETACGSGTTAVGLVEALNEGGSIEREVIQPSGMPIKIQVEFDGQKFGFCSISGPVQMLNQGKVK